MSCPLRVRGPASQAKVARGFPGSLLRACCGLARAPGVSALGELERGPKECAVLGQPEDDGHDAHVTPKGFGPGVTLAWLKTSAPYTSKLLKTAGDVGKSHSVPVSGAM